MSEEGLPKTPTKGELRHFMQRQGLTDPDRALDVWTEQYKRLHAEPGGYGGPTLPTLARAMAVSYRPGMPD